MEPMLRTLPLAIVHVAVLCAPGAVAVAHHLWRAPGAL